MKKKTLDAIDVFSVLQVDKSGALCIANTPLTETEVKNLQQEVKALKAFRIWHILQETVRHKAIEKAVLQSENWEHVLAGKMMLHNLGIQKTLVDILDKYTFPQKAVTPRKRGVELL